MINWVRVITSQGQLAFILKIAAVWLGLCGVAALIYFPLLGYFLFRRIPE